MPRGEANNIGKYHEHSTKEERIANATKAGIESGKARKEKKLLKDYLLALLEAKSETGNTYYDEITLALVKKALTGSEKAYEVIRDSVGQKAPELIEMSTNDIKINIGGDDTTNN